MFTQHLEVRATHRYVGSYRHLDAWQHVGVAKITPLRQVREGADIDDGGTYAARARIPAGQDPRQSMRALRDAFLVEGCHHEWDCCGCCSTSVTVKRVSRREFAVTVRHSFNY